jgi:hypothetical protein
VALISADGDFRPDDTTWIPRKNSDSCRRSMSLELWQGTRVKQIGKLSRAASLAMLQRDERCTNICETSARTAKLK